MTTVPELVWMMALEGFPSSCSTSVSLPDVFRQNHEWIVPGSIHPALAGSWEHVPSLTILITLINGGGGCGSVDVVSIVAVKLEGTSADAVRALKKFLLCRVSTEI
ncbi:hypothetical protein Tco_1575162 [Tanacetum coccineum]